MDDPVKILQDLGAPGWIVTGLIVLILLGLVIKQFEGLQPRFSLLGRSGTLSSES